MKMYLLKYRKDKDSFELLSIKTFLDNINSSITKNKKDARKEFNTVKKNVQSESLEKLYKIRKINIWKR